MKEIVLTKGMVALVDDGDFEWLSKWKWCASKKNKTCYAVRSSRLPNGKKVTVLMHRVLLGDSSDLEVDHLNGNGLDNRRENLRYVTHQQNQYNRPANSNNKSGYKGVFWNTQKAKWSARIRVNGRNIQLCTCDLVIEAARAYDAAALKHFGKFARVNFPGGI